MSHAKLQAEMEMPGLIAPDRARPGCCSENRCGSTLIVAHGHTRGQGKRQKPPVEVENNVS